MIAPTPIVRVYSEVIRQVALYIRAKSCGKNRISDDELHDLMDAIHNIPELITRYGEFFTVERMREYFWHSHDYKWVSRGGLNLTALLDRAESQHPKPKIRAKLVTIFNRALAGRPFRRWLG